MSARSSPSGGPAVDARGDPIVDPTANVLLLVEAANKRQDDLRAANEKLQAAEVKRVNAELGCIKEVAQLRSKHERQLRKAEASRVDSIRLVDKSYFDTTIAEIRAAVKALAEITTGTATTLQSRVDNAATTLAKQGADQSAEVIKRIAALELSAAQGIGKQAVEDPHLKRLSEMVEGLSRGRATDAGKSEGLSAGWAILLGVVGLIGGLGGIAGMLYAVLKP